MTGRELKALRASSGLGVVAFARALGYEGSDATLSRKIRRHERALVVPRAVEGRARTWEALCVEEDYYQH